MMTWAREKGANSNWFTSNEVKSIYVMIVSASFWLFYMMFGKEGATLTHMLHTLWTFLMWHGTTGQPFNSLAGDKLEDLTVWEQLEGEKHFTKTKKFYTISTIVVFALSLHLSEYGAGSIVINAILFLFAFVPKSPYLHKARIFS
eukprot:TRINITY_DN917_c0_g1_i1.p1 TRINITY_DN917_c0_g1~~TRINITY_DN917_c0_g1_i1.p1  ORF type:complete len:145 (-),score=32.65 TRINITY_DN917_c0_g1_i1:56-490(-)